MFPVAVIVLEKVAAPVTATALPDKASAPLDVICKAPVIFVS